MYPNLYIDNVVQQFKFDRISRYVRTFCTGIILETHNLWTISILGEPVNSVPQSYNSTCWRVWHISCLSQIPRQCCWWAIRRINRVQFKRFIKSISTHCCAHSKIHANINSDGSKVRGCWLTDCASTTLPTLPNFMDYWRTWDPPWRQSTFASRRNRLQDAPPNYWEPRGDWDNRRFNRVYEAERQTPCWEQKIND